MKLQLKKPTKKQVRHFFVYCLIVMAGNAVAAAASTFFIIPGGFVMGGTTGLGIFVRNLVDEQNEWLVSFTVYAANIVLFVLGAAVLGKKFAIATLAGTLFYPSFVSLFTYLNELYVAAYGTALAGEDPWLAIVCGSVMFGAGIGCVIRVGSSTGGTDIPPLILQKYFNIPPAVTLWALDIIIVLIQLVAVPPNIVLYGVVITILSSVVVELVSPIGLRKRQVQIVSGKWRHASACAHRFFAGGALCYHDGGLQSRGGPPAQRRAVHRSGGVLHGLRRVRSARKGIFFRKNSLAHVRGARRCRSCDGVCGGTRVCAGSGCVRARGRKRGAVSGKLHR